MASDKISPKPRRRPLPGSDWLMVVVGILALAGSIFLFIESDAPKLAHTQEDNSVAS